MSPEILIDPALNHGEMRFTKSETRQGPEVDASKPWLSYNDVTHGAKSKWRVFIKSVGSETADDVSG
jgi:hypothetical protein